MYLAESLPARKFGFEVLRLQIYSLLMTSLHTNVELISALKHVVFKLCFTIEIFYSMLLYGHYIYSLVLYIIEKLIVTTGGGFTGQALHRIEKSIFFITFELIPGCF